MLSWFFRFSKDDGGEAPRFVLPLSPIRASDGEPTKLLCTLTGKPIPTVSWFCGQREICPSRDFQPHFEPSTGTASLTIAEVYPDDEGVYRCRATNKFGTAECEAPLTVGDMVVVSHQELIRAPVIAQPLEPDRVRPGDRKLMIVRFDGYPTPVVKWYHDVREIQQTDNMLITTFKNESTMIIARATKELSGKYEARALNEGGEARTSATLLVTDDKPSYEPPKFVTALRPQIVPEGEATIMEVEVESVPEAVFSWKQHGVPIDSTPAVQIVSENNRSTLFIPESFVEHSGIFTVKAENPAGSIASTATLTVEHLLTPEEFTLPVVERELQSVKVMDGEEVRLTCKINGVPMPRIKWYHDGQPVREHHGVRMTLSPSGEAVLHMAEVFPEDDGLYECKAVNPAGQACTSAVLTIERYEYVPDSESASITAGPSISTWDDVTGPSGSEDDLLSDKPVVKRPVKKVEKKMQLVAQESKDEELINKDSGIAPRFITPLSHQVDIKDGQQARFEVKVESFPKAVVTWYLNGKELVPSKEFGIDNLEDGTSILTLSEVFPDDAGELMCDAQNDKGVATSVTQLNITAEHYKDTKEYRKPEWVSKMEVIRAKMAESEQPPQFTKEIFDARVQETETAFFEAFFAGNPKPDICWFYNDKLIKPNPNIKIRIKDGYSSCTLTEVTEEMAGDYSCKAITSAATVVTKAKLVVSELTGPAREAWLEKKAAKKAAEEKERKDAERLKRRGKLTKEEYLLEKDAKKKKKSAREAQEKEAEEEAKKIKEAQALEAQIVAAKKEHFEKERKAKEEHEKAEKEQREKAEAELKLSKMKKAIVRREMTVDEKLDKFVAQQAIGLRALLEMTERESLNVTEVIAQDKAKEFEADKAPFQEFVKVEEMLRSGVTVDQIVTMGAIGNLPVLTAPESQTALVRLVEDQGYSAVVRQAIVREATRLAPEEPIGLKAVLRAVETNTANIQEIVDMAANPQEFNIEAAPMPEIATVSTLLNEGISCEEMLTIVKAGELPALNLPETQWPLVQIMDKLGQDALVTQVIVEEPALNQATQVSEPPKTNEEKLEAFVNQQAIGLRALVEVAAQQSISVTEVAPVEKIAELLPEAPIEEFGKVDTMLKAGVGVDQIVALASTSPLTILTAPETQKALVRIVEEHGHQAVAREVIVKEAAKLAPEEPIGLKAVLKAVELKTANIRDVAEMATHPEEFDLTSEPLPEMATVSACLHEGVSCEDVLTMVKAGELPSLKHPETQWPLVQIIERLGQTALVSQVIAEESALGLVGEVVVEEYSTESVTDMLSTATIQQAESMVLPGETAASESVAPIVQPSVEPAKAAVDLGHHGSVIVFQSQPIENETPGARFVAPQSQRVTVEMTPKEAFVTGTQMQVQHSDDYQVIKPTTVTLPAKVVSTQEGRTAQVTVVQTTSVAGQLKMPAVVKETATFSMSSMETAEVSQVWDYRREDQWSPQKSQPVAKTAQAVTSSELKSVLVQETRTVEAAGQLNVQQVPTEESATSVASLLETPSLFAPQILQAEKPLEDFVASQSQTARPVAPSEQKTVQVSQVQTHLREGALVIEQSLTQTAKTSVPAAEVASQSQEIVMDDVLPQESKQTVSVQPIVSFTEQRAVSVAHVVESTATSGLVVPVKPEEKTAVSILPENLVTGITQVEVAFKEAPLEDKESVPTQTAHQVPEEHRTVQVSQVQATQREEPLEIQQTIGKFAQPSQMIHEVPVVDQVTVMELPTSKETPQLPQESASIGVVEHKAVSVSHIIEVANESELKPETKKKSKKATKVLPEKTETTIQNVQVAFKEAPLDESPAQMQTAKAVTDEMMTVQVSQVQPEIKEQSFESSKPVTKTAVSKVPENDTVVVTQELVMDTAKPQVPVEVTSEKPVVSMTEQRAVSVSQVVEGSSESELVPEVKKKTKKASKVLPEKVETTVSDVQVAFKEAPLDDFVPAAHKSASVTSDEKHTVQVTEVVSELKEAPLSVEKPTAKSAKVDVQEIVAPVSVEHVVLDQSVPATTSTTAPEEMASIVLPEKKAVSVSSVVEASTEVELAPITKPKEKKARKVLPEKTETTISQTETAIKEKPLEIEQPVRQTAKINLPDKSAAVIKTEAVVMESVQGETPLLEKPEKKAQMSVTEQKAVAVQSNVEESISESTFVQPTPVTQTAKEERAESPALATVTEQPATLEDEVSMSEDSFHSLHSSTSTLVDDTMMTAASSLEDMVAELEQLPEVPEEPVAVPVKIAEEAEVSVKSETDVSLKTKKKKKTVKVEGDDVEQQITIKSAVKSEDQESVAVVKLQKTTKPTVQDVEEEVTFKAPVKPKEEPVVEEVAFITQKKQYQVEDVEEEQFTLKSAKKPEIIHEDVESQATLKLKQEEETEHEDVEESFQIGLKPKPKVEQTETEQQITLKPKKEKKSYQQDSAETLVKLAAPESKATEVQVVETVETAFVAKSKPVNKPYNVEELQEEEFQVKPVLKKKIEEEHVENSASFKLKEAEKEKQEIEEQFEIGLKPKPKKTEDIEGETVSIQKKRKSTVKKTEEASDAATLVIRKEDDSALDSSLVESESSKLTDSGLVSIADVRRFEEDTTNDDVSAQFSVKKPVIKTTEPEESARVKIPAKPKSVAPTFREDSAYLTVKQAKEVTGALPDEETAGRLEVQEGDQMFALCSFVSDSNEAMNLVEGERVYILESHNSDWWFVRKHLTEETGWVPAQFLQDGVSYTHYVEKKLDEKINKLPVFDLPGDETKVQAPHFISKLQAVHVPDGGSVTFECKVEGHPRPVITWFRQTACIKQSPDFMMVYDDETNIASLTIAEVFPEDAGTFTCVAKNAAGFASSSAELVVEAPLSDHGSESTLTSRRSLSRESSLMDILEGIPPTFSQRPRTKIVEEGTDVELECRLVAVPEPEVVWFHNGKRIKETERIAVLAESDVHMYCSIILIKDVQKADAGTYDIIARNREGEAINHVILEVKVKEIKKIPPVVEHPLTNRQVQSGHSVVFTARVSGFPLPEVKWFRNDQEITPGPNVIIQQAKNGDCTLTIRSADTSDAGEYVLKAVNEHGSAETKCELTINPVPEPLRFVEKFSDLTVAEGSSFDLKAVLSSTAEVAWYRNSKRLKTTKTLIISDNGQTEHTLHVTSAQIDKETGEYKCVATSSTGQKISHSAQVNVEANVFIQPLEDTVIELNTDVELKCRTKEPVEVKWFRNDMQLKSNGKHEMMQSSDKREHVLVLHSAGKGETGRYSCTFENQTSSCVLSVRAEPSPEFVTKIRDLEIKERQQVTFEVEVSTDTAQVTWHKDGEPIKEDATGRYAFVTDGRKRQLIITSVSLHDEGEYTCSLGEHECTAELTVIELPPEITLQLKDVTVKRGEEASFEIELTKGDAKIQWFRDDQEIQLSEHIQLAIDGKRQKLVIVDCGPDDAKEYQCRIGEQRSSARLTVLAPEVDFTARLPELVTATMGQDVTFTVVLSKEADVWWIKNGEAIAESDRIKMTKDGLKRSLTISKTVIEDSAEYTCILDTLKCSTVLTVDIPRLPPSIAPDQIQTEVWVKRGEDCVVDIPYNGFPTPKSEWTFKGKAIRKTKRSTYTITESSAQLTLRGVEESEAGAYTCKLINDVGEASVTVTVKLVGKPESPSAPECLETADDSITIMWKPPVFNGGSEIINYIIEYQEKNTKKWIVANKDVTVTETTYMVTKLTYNSEYRFRVSAVNTAGPGSPSSESLMFKAAKPANPEAPVVREQLKDTTAGLKQNITLSCIIVGVPTPTLTWYKDHTPFKPTAVSYEAGSARLTLSNTTEEDAGLYTVEATNDSGTVESSCTLLIQESPKIVPEKKAKIFKTKVEKQWSVTAKVGGLPRPDVVWTKNGESIEGDTHYIVNTESLASTVCTTTLTIINTERTDTAKYTLTATNAAGSASYDVTLKISDKPTKPQGPITGKDIDKSSVSIEWKPPLDNGGVELKGYLIEYTEYLKEEWTKVEEVVTTTMYRVPNLQEGLEYVFRISATNDVGNSDWLVSEPILIKNQFDVPSAPRGPIEVSGMTDTTCFIKWVAPANNGGSPINEYLVERREVSKKAWQKVGTVDGNTTVIEAVALKKDMGYNFRISAQNLIGYGPPYTPEDVITVGKRITSPSQPTNLHAADITSRSVTLQWSPPVTTGGAELTGYIIEKRMEGTDKWEKVVTLDPSVTLYCIQNLKEKSEYYFRVIAENPMGLSPVAETEKLSLKTHATVPSPPGAPLEVRPVGPNSIIVEWGIPESDGGSPIEGYIVAVRESHKTMWMEVGQVDADTTRHIVKELQEGHKYFVRVFARNEVGLSDPLETEEPFKVVRPPDYLDTGSSGSGRKDRTTSCSTETLSSWMRENSMDAGIKSYSTSSLLRRDEYFFRIWFYSKQLFK